MATTKVSALSALTTTDGAEELLINDGGTSKKVTIANLLHDNSIDSDHYVDGSIDNAHLADDAVGVAELSATGTASSSTFLRGDNAWATPAAASTATASATGVIKIEDDTDQSVAANAVSATAGKTYGLQLNSSDQGVVNVPWTDTNTTYSVTDGELSEINFTSADHTKLNAIEASADVTDATNVTAAGALMDSEVTNLAEVKAFAASDYATAAQGSTADAALPKAGGSMTGNIVMADDTSIGIADDAERIEFDGAGDISFLGANIGIGNSAPSSALSTPLILHLGSGSTTHCGIVFEDDEQKWEIQHNGDMAFRKDTSAHFRISTTGLQMDAGGGTVPIGKNNTDTSNTGSVTLDFGAYQNHILTLTGNVTLANPTTEVIGQSGFITLIQDGTGSRTVALGTDYETAGGAGLTLTSTASATDIVPYVVAAAGRILLGTPQLAFA
jgi:hypothetical protein